MQITGKQATAGVSVVALVSVLMSHQWFEKSYDPHAVAYAMQDEVSDIQRYIEVQQELSKQQMEYNRQQQEYFKRQPYYPPQYQVPPNQAYYPPPPAQRPYYSDPYYEREQEYDP